jgi:hypothetical protein
VWDIFSIFFSGANARLFGEASFFARADRFAKLTSSALLGKDTNDMPISSGDKDVLTLAKSNSTPSILSAVPDRLAENSKRVSAPSGALRVPGLLQSAPFLIVESDI